MPYQTELHGKASRASALERERLLRPYLPDPTTEKARAKKQKPKPIRTFIKSTLHFLIYFCIHIFFSIYIRLRQAYQAVLDRVLAILYYHHRTPELVRKDVRGLTKLPEHLSVILTLRKNDDALDIIVDEVAELLAWSSCAGIPVLSVYEKTGMVPTSIHSSVSLSYKG